MWEFYLAGVEISFRFRTTCVFQIQLAKRRETLPIVRDYMTDREEALKTADVRLSDSN
jgi:cyclopropane-fatty-acyl-phospholipid synthase